MGNRAVETVPIPSKSDTLWEDPIISVSGSQTSSDRPITTTSSEGVGKMEPVWNLHGTWVRNNVPNQGEAQPPRVITKNDRQQQSLRELKPDVIEVPQVLQGRSESHWRCPPPPRVGKQWTQACMSQQHGTVGQEPAQPIYRNYNFVSNLSTSATILLLIATILAFTGFVLWLLFTWNYASYSNRNCNQLRHAKQKINQFLHPYWGREFGWSRKRESTTEGWLSMKQTPKEGENILLEAGTNTSLQTKYHHFNSKAYPVSKIYSEDDEAKNGGSAEKVFLDGLLGSVRRGRWARRTISFSSPLDSNLQEASLEEGGNSQEPSDNSFVLKHQLLVDACTGGPLRNYGGKQVGLSDSIRSASGTDFMSVEKNDMPLSFRRDAVLRQAIRGEYEKRPRGFGGD